MRDLLRNGNCSADCENLPAANNHGAIAQPCIVRRCVNRCAADRNVLCACSRRPQYDGASDDAREVHSSWYAIFYIHRRGTPSTGMDGIAPVGGWSAIRKLRFVWTPVARFGRAEIEK